MVSFQLLFNIVKTYLVLFLLFAFFSGTTSYAQQVEIKIEKNLRKEHPRLMFTKDDQLRVEELAKKDPLLQNLIEELYYQADQFLSEPVIVYDLVGPRPRLLAQSRACLTKVLTLSTAYRLSKDMKYAKRAIEEMNTAIAFPDWNPSHFLDVAEMGTALAIGYDWLFDILSQNEKESIKAALIKYALEPGLSVHPGRFRSKINNWNVVCNGGLIISALAIAEDDPTFAEKIIHKALHYLPNALNNYAPDGAWFEGPGYWNYATNYLSMMQSSMNSALGTDYGISDFPGLVNTGRFLVDAIGPSGDFFNYADGGKRLHSVPPALLWLAQHYEQPILAYYNQEIISAFLPIFKQTDKNVKPNFYAQRLFALEIAWYTPGFIPEDEDIKLNTLYRGLTDVAFFRSSWEEDAVWAGFKTGKNSLNHAHLDCGNFVFESGGHRWAEDLGDGEYDLPGYFDRKSDGARRWNYFRTSSISHNVPTINNKNQRFNSDTKILAFDSSPERSHAVADLSTAYTDQAKSVKRGLAVLNKKELLVQDEVVALQQGDQYRWAMVTSAKVTLDGNRAELQIDDDIMIAEILQPANAVFDTASTKPTYHPDETPNPGTCLLTVSVKLDADNINTIAVTLKPKEKTSAKQNKIRELSKWEGYFENVNK